MESKAGGFPCRGDSSGGRQAAFALALRFEASETLNVVAQPYKSSLPFLYLIKKITLHWHSHDANKYAIRIRALNYISRYLH